MLRRSCSLVVCLCALQLAQASAASPVTEILRPDGIGPLTLGMTTSRALATGWLGSRGSGCQLGGPPTISFRARDPRHRRGMVGVAHFVAGRLHDVAFIHGVTTSLGVTVAKTRTARMIALYRAAGYKVSATYVSALGGTIVEVRESGHQVIAGFGEHGRVGELAVPDVQVCE